MSDSCILIEIDLFAVLNMEDRIGNFEIDKEFDALLIDVSAPGSAVDIFSKVRK